MRLMSATEDLYRSYLDLRWHFDPTAASATGVASLDQRLGSFDAESMRTHLSAFKAIPRGQYEGGYSIGLTDGQTMRLVILPQLIRIALPGLSNLWLILLKDTALVSAIGLTDIVRQAYVAARVTQEAFLFFGLATLIYLALAILSSFGIGAIERSVKRQEVAR